MKSGGTMLIMFILYRPGTFFFSCGCVFFSIAFVLGIRAIILSYVLGVMKKEYLPSLILLSILALMGSMLWMLSIIGEILRAQRRVNEEVFYQLRNNSKAKTINNEDVR
ncbi:MAG: hypothetical protein GY750_15305 [Lentisphaerae bacterium]|nr:hypothetical protein [Lentisphaerota bacterium]MCP4102765.1 hypothetical protein [Lentisphaerota bacterium]